MREILKEIDLSYIIDTLVLCICSKEKLPYFVKKNFLIKVKTFFFYGYFK